jgi:D-3-phosphoglycerate dehydrogenase
MILFCGDLALSARQINLEFEGRGYTGPALTHEWHLANNEEMVRLNRHHELQGAEGSTDAEELRALIGSYAHKIDGLVTQFFPVSAELIDELPSLQFIATIRSGIQNIDAAAAQRRGIPVYNNPGRNAAVVADFTVGLMLSTCRGITTANRVLLEGTWLPRSARQAFRTLSSTKIGLVGFGQVGRLVARLLRGFDCELRVYDPYIGPADVTDNLKVCASLQELLESSEVVSLHAKLTEDTAGLIGAKELGWLGPDGILINTARAGLIDEGALVAALSDGSLCAAALDVFSEEPLPEEHVLRQLPNVTLTPHLAGGSRDALVLAARMLADRLQVHTPAALWRSNVTKQRSHE